jgi:Family of unknown function (DUF6350)
VTDLQTRLPPDVLARLDRTRWLVAAGAAGAVAAAAAVLLALAAVTVLLWASAPHADRVVAEAVRTAGLAWLLGHRVPIGTPSGDLTVAPLLITAGVVFVAIRAGAWAVRSGGAASLRSVAVTTAGFAVTYAGLAGVVAALAGGTTFAPSVRHAVGAGLGLAALAGAAGAAGAAPSAGLLDGLPPPLGAAAAGAVPAVRAGAAGVLTIVGGGALVTAVSLGWHAEQTGQLFAAVTGGWAAALGVLTVCAAYLPNAAVWAASFAAGPGFAVGYGTHVGLGGVQLGAAPVLPLLAALPGSGPAPLPSYAALAVPAAAGVVTGLVADRGSRDGPLSHAVLAALAAAGAAGTAMGVLAWLAGGSAGGRLAPLGPPAWPTGVAVAAELAIVALPILLLARWRAHPARGAR